jgi:His/Glu/Gln/Arg/opine family amino acid ABC transporter permease subunit
VDLLNLQIARDYTGVLLQGLAITVGLTFAVISLSLVLAVPVALARMSRSRLLRTAVGAYVEIMRGTPLLLQLVYIYYVLPVFGIKLGPITAGVIGLTLHYAAYLSEVYRSGIEAVPQGQSHAAAALGMGEALAFRRIVFPQALRIVTPTLGNYFIALFKDTALCSVLTVQELMFAGEIVAAHTYQYFTIYTLTALLYFAVGYPSALLVRRLERRGSRGRGRPVPAEPLPARAGAAP